MSVFDPRSLEFQSELVAVYQSMLARNAVAGELEASVVLIRLESGGGAPRFRSMASSDWEVSRSSAGNAVWTPVARVEVDGSVVRLL